MIQVNLVGRRALFFGLNSYFTEYLVPAVIGRTHVCPDSGTSSNLPRYSRFVNAIELPALTPELQERLMGKAPLRLIVGRTKVENYFEEVLECGHSYTAFQNFIWDEGAHLINLEPSAKRRRCVECKALQVSSPASPGKKPVQSVTVNSLRSRRIK